jgi:hypothetical protein
VNLVLPWLAPVTPHGRLLRRGHSQLEPPAGSRIGRQVAGIGASRRGGDRLTPELDSAFLRLTLPPDPSGATVRRMISKRPPEAYPPTRSIAPQAVTGALAGRLGSTFLVSNLGWSTDRWPGPVAGLPPDGERPVRSRDRRGHH